MRAVLIVVDLLNDFFDRSDVLSRERSRIVESVNELTRTFRSSGLPVIWVRQEFAPDLHDAPLEARSKRIATTIANTRGCEILDDLDRTDQDRILVKKRYSAFFGTDLDEQLAALQPDLLVVAGINTHACVRMTIVDAYQRDYTVLVAADCVASHDPGHHDVTLRYIDGKLGRVLSNAEIIELVREDGRNHA